MNGAAGERDVERTLAKPVLFVTGHAPPYRTQGLALLHEREGIEVALFGGRSTHGVLDAATSEARAAGGSARGQTPALGGTAPEPPPFPHRLVAQRALLRIAASGRYRAVVCSTGGRLALPAAWAGARLAGTPVILWSSLWAHPVSPAHLASYPLLRRLYRGADAVVTYGPHVSEYVRRRGASNVHVAPQAVDNDFWSGPAATPTHPAWPRETELRFLFAGRRSREKGLRALVEAWRMSGLGASTAALVLVGVGPAPPWVPAGGAVDAGIVCIEPVGPAELRDFYAACDVVVLPSIPTRTFREPWGLVINEAMNRSLPVIVTDAVGAAAGGLVRDERNGLVVPASDPQALAGALRRLASDAGLRERLGQAGARDVSAYTAQAWAEGFSQALASVGLSRGRW